MVISNLISDSTRKASVTYGKPYEDHHIFTMWAASFAMSSGTLSKMEASHEFIIAPSPSTWCILHVLAAFSKPQWDNKPRNSCSLSQSRLVVLESLFQTMQWLHRWCYPSWDMKGITRQSHSTPPPNSCGAREAFYDVRGSSPGFFSAPSQQQPCDRSGLEFFPASVNRW
jgi:hypothetical protein